MKAHIYIQYNSQPHHAVTHTCRLRSLDLMLLIIFTFPTVCQQKLSGCSFFRIIKGNHQSFTQHDRNTASCF